MTIVSGTSAYAIYGWETTYGTASGTIDKSFGHDVKITAFDMKNNTEKLYGLGNNEAQKNVVKQFEGSISLEWVLGNGYFLKAITGNTPTDAGSGPYTHTYVDGAHPMAKTIPSMTIDNGIDLDTDYRGKITGAVMNTLKLGATEGELVKVSADFLFESIDKDATVSSNIADSWAEPFNFSHGCMEMPDGTTISYVKDFDLTINRNTELIRSTCSRFPQSAVSKKLEYDFTADITFDDVSEMEDFLGGSSGPVANPSELASIKLTFDNGKSSTDQRKLEIKLEGIQLDEFSLPQSVDDIINESLTFSVRKLTSAVLTDNNATAL